MTRLIDSGATWQRQMEGTDAEAGDGGRVDFDLTRVQFLARAAVPDIPANVLKLGYVIAYKHMDVASRTAIVGQEALATDLNVTVRSIQNLLPKLTSIGLVIEPGDGRSKLSVYRIGSAGTELERAKAASPIDAERTNGIASFDGETAKPNSLFLGLPPRSSKRVPTEGFAGVLASLPPSCGKGRRRESLSPHHSQP